MAGLASRRSHALALIDAALSAFIGIAIWIFGAAVSLQERARPLLEGLAALWLLASLAIAIAIQFLLGRAAPGLVAFPRARKLR